MIQMVSRESQHQQEIQAFTYFLTTPLDPKLQQHIIYIEANNSVVELFHRVAPTVPADQEFLGSHNINTGGCIS